jgi:hypothetical protein
VPHASALHQPKKLGCPILRVVCEGRDDLAEQIDDICSRYPKYWLSDEAQRELQSLWGGPVCNDWLSEAMKLIFVGRPLP